MVEEKSLPYDPSVLEGNAFLNTVLVHELDDDGDGQVSQVWEWYAHVHGLSGMG